MDLIEWLFIAEMTKDWHPVDALRRAGYRGKNVRVAAAEMLVKPEVFDQLAVIKPVALLNLQLQTSDVLRDIINVLNADPRELIENVYGACRYCHGVDHLYQRTPQEFREHHDHHRGQLKATPLEGGEGFDPYADPHLDCPECFGRGIQRVVLKDTRDLSPSALALYEGVKQTQHGIEVKMRSKDAARAAAALFLGLNKETKILEKKVSDMTEEELMAIANGGAA